VGGERVQHALVREVERPQGGVVAGRREVRVQVVDLDQRRVPGEEEWAYISNGFQPDSQQPQQQQQKDFSAMRRRWKGLVAVAVVVILVVVVVGGGVVVGESELRAPTGASNRMSTNDPDAR
jgi:predicted anti-sigma-YlaC factor YlaD